jgi:hypothetical protein
MSRSIRSTYAYAYELGRIDWYSQRILVAGCFQDLQLQVSRLMTVYIDTARSVSLANLRRIVHNVGDTMKRLLYNI